MRDAMKDDIEKAIAALSELGVPKPAPERFTRKEQAKKAAASSTVPMDVDEGTQQGEAGSSSHIQVEEEASPEVGEVLEAVSHILMYSPQQALGIASKAPYLSTGVISVTQQSR
jgi:hypothetical protein